jgi:septum formation protein
VTAPTALPLILASASPRRRELIARLGLAVEIAPANVDEAPQPGEAPALCALRVARAKALHAAERFPESPVLAADTIVVLGQRILGKPADRSQAAAMLRALSGRAHIVITALAARWRGREATHLEQARVVIAPLPGPLIDWYVATGEADDKAGAYAVQGRAAVFVDRVEGNVQAVVGLPLAPLRGLFARVGLDLRPAGERLVLTPSNDR